MLTRGIEQTLRQGRVSEEALSHAFLALPAYGEDSSLLPELDDAAAAGSAPPPLQLRQ